MGGKDEMTPQQPQHDPPDTGQAAGQAASLGSRLRSRPRLVRLATIGGAVVAVAVTLSVIGAMLGPSRPSLKQAKSFSLQALGHPGRHISLASMSGRPVIVNFFASWCPPCQRETPTIARFYRDRHGRPAIIGIDVNDSAKAAQAFVRKSGVTYPVAEDPAPMKTAAAYGLAVLPATFFLNARHQIVKQVFGPITARELATGARLMARGR